MTYLSDTVSIHPYFRVHPGKLDEFKALMAEFISKTATEEACLFYEFSIGGDLVFCREAYRGGEGVLVHLENVGDILSRALKISDIERLEFHGAAAELDKLRVPLSDLNPQWFELECSLQKRPRTFSGRF